MQQAMAPTMRVTRRSKRAPAAANDGVLPTEVLFEILLRVPFPALPRLRLVCRSWRDLLTSDPAFARAHLSSRRRLLAAGVCKLRGEVTFVDVLSGDVAKRMPVHEARVRYGHNVTAQADYVCVQQQGSEGQGPCVVAVATGAATVLPAGVPVKHSAGDMVVNSTSLLGRVPSTGEYKVLRTHLCKVNSGVSYYHTCDVITLCGGGGRRRDGRRWRARPDPPMRISGEFERRVVVNGVAYFLSDPYNCNNIGPSDAIAAFDMATEEWRQEMLQGPLSSHASSADEVRRVRNISGRDLRLAEVNCFLVMVHIKQSKHLTDLWFLVDVDKGLWTKRYSVDTRSSPERRIIDRSLPLVILDDGRIVFWKQEEYVLRVYDPETRTWADVATVKDYFCIGMFKGSLLCSGIQVD